MQTVYDYETLIQRFLDGSTSIEDFERLYLDNLKAEWNNLHGKLYKILESLFFDVDAFMDDPLLVNDGSGCFIDENQLRERAAKALSELRALK